MKLEKLVYQQNLNILDPKIMSDEKNLIFWTSEITNISSSPTNFLFQCTHLQIFT